LNKLQIPAYALYGEFLEQVTPDVLHYEAIRDRSLKHDWSIRTHRHRTMAQMFLFSTPNVAMRVGERRMTTDTGRALYVPPMLPHGFQFEPSIVGGVISIPTGKLDHALETIGASHEPFRSAIDVPVTNESYDAIRSAFGEIEREFKQIRPFRNEALTTQLGSLLIHFQRASPAAQPPTASGIASRHEEQIRQFCNLVEAQFRSDMRLKDYAAVIGISKVQLTRTCTRILGTTPNQVVVNRRLMEAKRQLAYTQFPVGQISEELGFKDVGYFSRFFRKLTGKTPSSFRAGIQEPG